MPKTLRRARGRRPLDLVRRSINDGRSVSSTTLQSSSYHALGRREPRPVCASAVPARRPCAEEVRAMSATITVPSAPWRSPYEEIEVSLADLVARVRETAIEWSPPDVLALLTLRADLETDRKLLDD